MKESCRAFPLWVNLNLHAVGPVEMYCESRPVALALITSCANLLFCLATLPHSEQL